MLRSSFSSRCIRFDLPTVLTRYCAFAFFSIQSKNITYQYLLLSVYGENFYFLQLFTQNLLPLPTMQPNQQYSQEDIDRYITLNHQGQFSLPNGFEEESFPHLNCLSQILFHSDHGKNDKNSTIISRREKSKEATAKYRERKKEYVRELEDKVKNLNQQIMHTQSQTQKYKDRILQELKSSTKTRVSHNQNEQIFNQLQQLVSPNEDSNSIQYGDIDKINLLIDTLKYRIGPTGKERQAKINYCFKSIIHTLFPALHRYIMHTAQNSQDIFSEKDNEKLKWTKQLFQKLSMDSSQIQKVKKFKEKFVNTRSQSLSLTKKLNGLKMNMLKEQAELHKIEDRFRDELSPIQCGRWILFGEKHKYKKEIFPDGKFVFHEENEEDIFSKFISGRKKVKHSFEEE